MRDAVGILALQGGEDVNEDGPALALVKRHIKDVIAAAKERDALYKALGCNHGVQNRFNHTLSGVVFPGKIHPDFTKPKKIGGPSYPKKGTEWFKTFAQQKGVRPPAEVIAEAFNVPADYQFQGPGDSWGRGAIGGFAPCGFLYLSAKGPYALWIPDVPAILADLKKNHPKSKILAPDPKWAFNVPDCKRIEEEEWKILVLQQDLAEKKKAKTKT